MRSVHFKMRNFEENLVLFMMPWKNLLALLFNVSRSDVNTLDQS